MVRLNRLHNITWMMFVFLLALPTWALALRIGQKAPDFTLPDQNGVMHSLNQYSGHVVVLNFYPADMTPGCTCEMKSLRDNINKLHANGVVILGVSVDSVASHKQFAKELHLPFPILADPGKHMVEEYGALGSNGRANRITVIIDKKGVVKDIDWAVNAEYTQAGGELMTWHSADLALRLSDWKAKIGGLIPNFTLITASGKESSLFDPGQKGAVVMFIGTHCPVCKEYLGRLESLAKSSSFKGVHFVGLDSNVNETEKAVSNYENKYHLPFPIYKDTGDVLADHFGATHTPEVWVINSHGIAMYHGAIDDNMDPAKVKTSYLENALREMISGQSITTKETHSFGCSIQRAM